jgi:uncharacterized protein (TIGR03066 family)
MRTTLCGLVAVVFCGTLSADDKRDEKIDAQKLIGKWSPKNTKEDVVIEFKKGGKLTITPGGKGVNIDGTYKIDGNKMTTTVKFKDDEKVSKLTITKLTDTELVTTDESGKEETLVRVKDK